MYSENSICDNENLAFTTGFDVCRISVTLLLTLSSVPFELVHAQPKHSTQDPEELSRATASSERALFDAYKRCGLERFGVRFMDNLEEGNQESKTFRLIWGRVK